ncbi:MAG: tRNA (N(6)-L-threonylcarbamoyladenosine(37)-C(2))-methylthiotransferase MtaB [Bacteroidota bacterium]
MMKRIALHTLGCKLNYAESATIGRQFLEQGYTVVNIDQNADVVVINTCSVTENADRECRQVVRRALRHSPNAFVAVIGCYAQLQPGELASIDGVDLVLGTKEKFDVLKLLGSGAKKEKPEINVSCIDDIRETELASSLGYDERTRAFLKIQDGCDYRCSFCTIPRARGESRSVSLDSIVDQACEIAKTGYKEIVLTGVNVGDYGRTMGQNLFSLVRELVRVEGIERIRVSSIEPNLLSDELLDFWFSENKMCKHWHIPLQSGSNAILSSMRRRYRRELYREKAEKIKSAYPHAGIGADVIVGFPAETDEMFEETYEFVSALPVTYLHVFSYSARPGTEAQTMKDQVPLHKRAERSERLRQKGLEKRKQFAETWKEKILPVLFETKKNGDIFSGFTEEYIRVEVHSSQDIHNRILPAVIHNVRDEHCEGTLASLMY